ncbi:MAG: AAA family ATPase [Planctomycetes bacterium]|nr:AAA family ATPase [Planctomycetota bacterium]
MKLEQLITDLSSPVAYPHSVEHVRICQTHLSVVFLAGPFVYKIKKAVRFDFVDFGSLETREHFCREEVRLNRRLAPNVYLDVVPITQNGAEVLVEGSGVPIEWAVKMRWLPDDASLKHALLHGDVDRRTVEKLARRIAKFHASAASNASIAQFGRFDVVAGNARDNLRDLSSRVGCVISRSVFERLTTLTESSLSRLRQLIERRAQLGVPRDTHGDLRLEHVYLFPEQAEPNDLVIIDCIEFCERFRFADPVSDMAFLVMDLAANGRRDLAKIFADAYFQASGDDEGRALLPFYVSYRAAVRAKVGAMKSDEPEVPPIERESALARSRARAIQAMSELDEPGNRPCLILMAGLPGTGKSSLANDLAQHAHLNVIRTDVVRKELAALADSAVSIYTDDWHERTYKECLRRADAFLFEGKRVIVDSFANRHRKP